MTTTNTPFEEAVSQILIKLHHDGWGKGKKQVETPYTYTLDDEPKREAFRQLTQLHKAAVLEELENIVAEASPLTINPGHPTELSVISTSSIIDRIAQLKKEEE